MKSRLVKLTQFSGNEASVYSVIVNDEEKTLFDEFISENKNSFLNEIKDIVSRLMTIGHKEGARDQYFKLNEGNPGDGVCALYDQPKSNLRLYCIKYGKQLIILGSGGLKSKNIRTFQEDDKLKDENYFLRNLSKEITNKLKSDELKFINGGIDLEGDFEFYDEEE
jgi:hypothetical protein